MGVLFVIAKYLPSSKASFIILPYSYTLVTAMNIGFQRENKKKSESNRSENVKMNVTTQENT